MCLTACPFPVKGVLLPSVPKTTRIINHGLCVRTHLTACVHLFNYIHAYLTCCKQTVVLFKIKHLDDHRIDEQALV